MTVLILLAAAVGMAAGRWLMGRWFNHVTLYSAVWGLSLGLYALDLIQYYPILPRTDRLGRPIVLPSVKPS